MNPRKCEQCKTERAYYKCFGNGGVHYLCADCTSMNLRKSPLFVTQFEQIYDENSRKLYCVVCGKEATLVKVLSGGISKSLCERHKEVS